MSKENKLDPNCIEQSNLETNAKDNEIVVQEMLERNKMMGNQGVSEKKIQNESELEMKLSQRMISQNQILMEQNPNVSELGSNILIPSMNYLDGEMEEMEQVVIVSKEHKTVDPNEMMRLYKERIQKEAEIKQAKKERSRKRQEKTKEELKPQSNVFLPELRAKQNHRCQKMVREYRIMYHPSSYDTKLNLFKYDCKEKTFAMLCLAVEELRDREEERQRNEKQHSYEGMPLLSLSPRSLFNYLKRVVLEIDVQMRKLNKEPSQVGKHFRDQWECFLQYLQEEDNEELRRKVLLKELAAEKVPVSSELEFMPTAKREEIIQRDKRYLAEFSVEATTIKHFEQQFVQYEIKKQVQESTKHNKYIEPPILEQLEQYIGNGQIAKMRKRLQQDLSGKSRQSLLSRFEAIFNI